MFDLEIPPRPPCIMTRSRADSPVTVVEHPHFFEPITMANPRRMLWDTSRNIMYDLEATGNEILRRYSEGRMDHQTWHRMYIGHQALRYERRIDWDMEIPDETGMNFLNVRDWLFRLGERADTSPIDLTEDFYEGITDEQAGRAAEQAEEEHYGGPLFVPGYGEDATQDNHPYNPRPRDPPGHRPRRN